MKLFCKATPQTEPAPEPAPEPRPDDPIASAVAEEAATAAQVREFSTRCTALDLEQKSWSQRRDQAYRDFCTSLARHAHAKTELARLSKTQAA
jgi:hypothetical protein